MKEARSALDALMDYIKALTPAQADKLAERLSLLEEAAGVANA